MKGFKYLNKVSMIIGDSVTHGGHAFHPSIAEPPISIEDDEEGEEQDEEDGLSMDPSAVQHLIVSALVTTSAATGAHSPHLNTFLPLPTVHSAPALVISAAHSVPTTYVHSPPHHLIPH